MRPSLFVGSSTEGLEVARALQAELDPDGEVEIWSQGVFGLSEGTLGSLVAAVDRFDFAVLVLSPEDLSVSRGVHRAVPRDNVLFELGLFMGGLGMERTFILYDRSRPPDLPTDLAGVTPATFEPHAGGNMQAALGAAAYTMRRTMSRLGPRAARAGVALSAATTSLEDTTARVDALSRAMARSRVTELEITIQTFGPILGEEMVARIRQDLAELEGYS